MGVKAYKIEHMGVVFVRGQNFSFWPAALFERVPPVIIRGTLCFKVCVASSPVFYCAHMTVL